MAMQRSLRKCEKGTTAVEFGLVSLMFLMSLFGLLEVAHICWIWNTMQNAVQTATRYYLTNESTDDSGLQTFVQNKMSYFPNDTGHLTVTVTHSTASGVKFVQIDGAYKYSVLSGSLLPSALSNMTLSASAKLPVP